MYQLFQHTFVTVLNKIQLSSQLLLQEFRKQVRATRSVILDLHLQPITNNHGPAHNH